MALDTRGVVDGFMRGYQFVDNVKQRQRNNERQDRLDQERADYRDWQMNRAEERDAANAEHRQWQRDSTDDMNQLRAEQIGLQMDLSRNAEGRAQRQEGRQQQAFDAKQKRVMGQEVFASLANGAPLTEEHQAFIESNPQFDPRKFYDTKFHSSLDRLTGILEDKNIDEDELITLNRPEFLDDVNRVYRDVINKGEGGNKRISRIYPSDDPGKVFFSLEVTGDDGKTYRAPVTEGRDSNPGANVMPVDIGTAIEHLAGYNNVSQSIRQMNAEERGNFLKFGQDMGYITPVESGKVDKYVTAYEDGQAYEIGLDEKGNEVARINTGPAGQHGKGEALTPWTSYEVANMSITPEGSKKPIGLVSMATNRAIGAAAGYDAEGNRYIDEGRGWRRAASERPDLGVTTPDSEPKPKPEPTFDFDAAFQKARANPNNKNYTDEQIRQAIRQAAQ